MNILTITLTDWYLGISISILGYLVVMLALSFLYGIYSLIPKLIDRYNRYQLKRKGRHECAEKDSLDITGEEAAAIASALYHYFNELHDVESGKITIKKISKRYSPWSSKIYETSMNNFFSQRR